MSQEEHVADKQESVASSSDSDDQPIMEQAPKKRQRGSFLN